MKLSFLRQHKSITSLQDIDLPSFAVLTGINGAGKSHLLEAIESGAVQIDDIVPNPHARSIRRFDWTNLIPQDTGAFAPSQITQERYGLWSELSLRINDYRSQITETLRQLNRFDLMNLSPRQLISLTPETLIASGTNLEQANQIVQSIGQAVSSASQNVTNIFTQGDPPNRHRLLSLINSNINIPLIALEENDFYDYFPRSWQPVDMFQQSFGRLFADYRRTWLENQLKALAHSKGEPISFLTDEEFLDKYGIPPWAFVNSILETANLDFRINEPPKYEDRLFEPILTDQIRGAKVKFSDLSSGERILMSFALCLYYAGDARQIVDYPKVLLFDEIDAPLHPSMTQSLLRTIQEVLICKHNIKVILTTHSPSTVALSTEKSLYIMNKVEQKRIQKITKDQALAILTTGVPTLSINYENRRQVFVESKHDVTFYEMIYKKLRNNGKLENKLGSRVAKHIIESAKLLGWNS
jgi:ABC-type cobalamin/Fe3+-siderophores transport system ATPase subunit